MSDNGDREYKPNKQQLQKQGIPPKKRPVQTTRNTKEYKDIVVVTDSEEETSQSESGGELAVGDSEEKELTPDLSVKSEVSWTPSTINRNTESIIQDLTDLREQLTKARMSKQTDTSMADIMKLMLEMSTRDKQERERRKEEREERRRVRDLDERHRREEETIE